MSNVSRARRAGSRWIARASRTTRGSVSPTLHATAQPYASVGARASEKVFGWSTEKPTCVRRPWHVERPLHTASYEQRVAGEEDWAELNGAGEAEDSEHDESVADEKHVGGDGMASTKEEVEGGQFHDGRGQYRVEDAERSVSSMV